ncbi:hypothetical protein [uncultured Microbulbifer sp.]|uniref:hypothetical protein n=1 Tax=uncultured Microbulbifer sp. TaxID=348147 RepID=UPI0025DC3116|nr:hypothetical protein [uncultured Microbulbifer sp.]
MQYEAREPFWSSFSAALCALLLYTFVSTGHGATSNDDFWEKYADVSNWASIRLKLTPEQEAKALPILEKNFDRKLQVLEEFGFTDQKTPKLTEQQLEQIDAKFIAIRAETRAEMAAILNAEQLEELKKIQREYHEEFRARIPKI